MNENCICKEHDDMHRYRYIDVERKELCYVTVNNEIVSVPIHYCPMCGRKLDEEEI